jgi:esterase/lipase
MQRQPKLTLKIGRPHRYHYQTHQWRNFLTIGFGFTLLILSVLFRPWGLKQLQSHPNPVTDYAGAVTEIAKLRSETAPDLSPAGQLLFLTHGRQVKRVIVFVHGYTNCPRQFQQLGGRFFILGYNVLVAPLPYHGLMDRMNTKHAKLTAEDMIAYGDRMVDIAQGLGEQVTIAGLSVGGNIAAWAAQNRSDVDQAVLMAPVFGYRQIPLWLTTVTTNLYLTLPNFFQWWNPKTKTAAGVPHSYPRFSSRALAQSLRLGYAVQAQARQVAPLAQRILVITNANDPSVHPVPIASLVHSWRSHGATIRSYEFPAKLRLGHDFIDPQQRDANPKAVYPRLIELINQGDTK